MASDHIHIDTKPNIEINNVIFSDETQAVFTQFLKEYKHRDTLQLHGLAVANKMLFYGASGCGKTLTAQALATTLNRKLITANLSAIVSSRLGQTAHNISHLFQKVRVGNAVLFLDEFDSLGAERTGSSKESGEMRRVVNTIIQLIDNLDKDVLLIAATNQVKLIDHALVRRFEHKIEFTLPDNDLLDRYYDNQLSRFPPRFHSLDRCYQISFAEAKVNIMNAVKKIILDEAEEAIITKNKDSNE